MWPALEWGECVLNLLKQEKSFKGMDSVFSFILGAVIIAALMGAMVWATV